MYVGAQIWEHEPKNGQNCAISALARVICPGGDLKKHHDRLAAQYAPWIIEDATIERDAAAVLSEGKSQWKSWELHTSDDGSNWLDLETRVACLQGQWQFAARCLQNGTTTGASAALRTRVLCLWEAWLSRTDPNNVLRECTGGQVHEESEERFRPRHHEFRLHLGLLEAQRLQLAAAGHYPVREATINRIATRELVVNLHSVERCRVEPEAVGDILLSGDTHSIRHAEALIPSVLLVPHDEQARWTRKEHAASVWRTAIVRWFLETSWFFQQNISQGLYGAASPKPTTFLITGIDRQCATDIELMSRTTTMPANVSIGRENGQWRTSKLKEYPDALCSYIARLFRQWLVRHESKSPRDFSTEATWLQDLIVQEDAAVTSFGPDYAHNS